MGFDQAPVQALSMSLVDEGKQAHDNQSSDDTHDYEVLRHDATPGPESDPRLSGGISTSLRSSGGERLRACF